MNALQTLDDGGQHDDLAFHPIAEVFPLMEGESYANFVADIKANGVHEPIWLYEGLILDGRNRYRAAREAGHSVKRSIYNGDRPIEFVLSLNLHRRHLSESQRAMLGTRLATLEQGQGGETRKFACFTQAQAAEQLNVSKRLVQSARAVVSNAPPELVAAVDHNRIKVSQATRIMALPDAERQEVLNEIVKHPERAGESARIAIRSHESADDEEDGDEERDNEETAGPRASSEVEAADRVASSDEPADEQLATSSANILALVFDKKPGWATRSDGQTLSGQADLGSSRLVNVGKLWIKFCAFLEERVEASNVTEIYYAQKRGRDSKELIRFGGYLAHLQLLAETRGISVHAVERAKLESTYLQDSPINETAGVEGTEAKRLVSHLPMQQQDALRILQHAGKRKHSRQAASPAKQPHHELPLGVAPAEDANPRNAEELE